MASRILAAPVQRSKYICDSCLSGARLLRNKKVAAPRVFSTASSQTFQVTTQRRCRRSQHDRRPIAVSATHNGFSRLPTALRSYFTEASTAQAIASGIAPLPHRSLIFLSGPTASKFLHGLITHDATRVSPFYAAFLDARGRVICDVFIWVWPELIAQQGHWACYIEVDAGQANALMLHLKRHKLRHKLTISHVPAEGRDGIKVWAAWGDAHKQVKDWGEIAGLQDPRAPGMYRYLANADRETIARDMQPVDTKFYDIQRYIHGVPEGSAEMPPYSTLPMEANIDLSSGIDFKKGCYIGQELTIRTKHTGVVRKRILPVRFHAGGAGAADPQAPVNPSFAPQPQPGMDIRTLDDTGALSKGRPTGRIVAAIGNVGLATCRIENMTSMRVSTEGGFYKEGTQFGVDVDGQVVRVEPVVHDWFVERKEALWGRGEKMKKSWVEKAQEELD
ncbi:transferase CAF17 [Parastagonospora nodorum]|uniref:Iron-sulfur cluster assembly factor IBA57 homolog, mitochondrial n=1 Tax=Phaeosphaeria nodorum (strain SN15 / ATCC MYA-4574 / FGSC 10173) TaxID=321614 RepID=A0A7U2FFC0_PHANO|nr:transferase CAF17 [Parastagonospora nodorum]QRD03219.1 transferase CAF17 [Parastagonospora nodorum SN15]KAH3922233.1 transferase CAF17 [Parastagonospora nodorum]KAH4138781.1 transferase CAF17 [Parastagonospora nodorum]KAH4163196.1 transferase CAF17 [Parastagonospora nodorum]